MDESLWMHFGVLFLLPFVMYVMYVWLNGEFAYDKKSEKEIENIFGRCIIKYLLPFISPIILFFFLCDFFLFFYDEGLVSRIKYPSLRSFLSYFGPLFYYILVSCLFGSIVYGWCWVGKCVKNVFSRRGLIIYCVISSIIFIAYIAHIPYIIREILELHFVNKCQ